MLSNGDDDLLSNRIEVVVLGCNTMVTKYLHKCVDRVTKSKFFARDRDEVPSTNRRGTVQALRL